MKLGLKLFLLLVGVFMSAVLVSLWLLNANPRFDVPLQAPDSYFLINRMGQRGEAYKIYPEGWSSANYDLIVPFLKNNNLFDGEGEVIVFDKELVGCSGSHTVAIASKWLEVPLFTQLQISPGEFPHAVSYIRPMDFYYAEGSSQEYQIEIQREILPDGFNCSEATVFLL